MIRALEAIILAHEVTIPVCERDHRERLYGMGAAADDQAARGFLAGIHMGDICWTRAGCGW